MPKSYRGETVFLIALPLMAVAMIRLWVLPLNQSFWLDESLVVWTIRGGFTQIVPKAFVSLQSIAFCMLEWPIFQAGAREVGLRLPSLAAALGTVWVLYRIGVQILDRELGLILAAMYVATPAIAPEVPNARPYALAVFAHAAGLLWLLKWLRSGRLHHGSGWVVCSVLGSYFQHLFLIPLALEWFYVALRQTATWPVRRSHVWIFGLAGVLLLIPQFPQLGALLRQGGSLSFVPRPDWPSLPLAVIPVLLAFSIAIAVATNWLAGQRPHWNRLKSYAAPAVLGALLLFVPATVFFAFSRFTGWRYFTQRYLTMTVPGGILLWGWLLRQLGPISTRGISIVALLLIVNLAAPTNGGLLTGPVYHAENWREAVLAMPDSGTFLVYPGLVETRRLDWLQEPERRSYFMAPLTVYRATIPPEATFIVPFEFSASSQAYMVTILDRLPRYGQPITIIALEGFSGHDWVEWLSGKLATFGLSKLRWSSHERVSVVVFSN